MVLWFVCLLLFTMCLFYANVLWCVCCCWQCIVCRLLMVLWGVHCVLVCCMLMVLWWACSCYLLYALGGSLVCCLFTQWLFALCWWFFCVFVVVVYCVLIRRMLMVFLCVCSYSCCSCLLCSCSLYANGLLGWLFVVGCVHCLCSNGMLALFLLIEYRLYCIQMVRDFLELRFLSIWKQSTHKDSMTLQCIIQLKFGLWISNFYILSACSCGKEPVVNRRG